MAVPLDGKAIGILRTPKNNAVVPAKAGTSMDSACLRREIPAFAGMTTKGR